MSTLSAFITQITNLVDELHALYPKDSDILMGKNSLYLIKKTNPRKLLELFRNHVLPYEKFIIDNDENFFLNNTYKEQLQSNYNDSLQTILNLKKYWSSMSDNTKKNIWLYFNILVKLCKMCN